MAFRGNDSIKSIHFIWGSMARPQPTHSITQRKSKINPTQMLLRCDNRTLGSPFPPTTPLPILLIDYLMSWERSPGYFVSNKSNQLMSTVFAEAVIMNIEDEVIF